MDLKAYYRSVREAEASLEGDHIVTVSLVTPEGGKAGVMTEASRGTAAKLIAERRARVASKEEAEQFHQDIREAKERHEQLQAANRMQVMVIPSRELNKERS